MSLLCSGVANSTARSYASSQRRYLRFCSLIDSKPLPATEVDLLSFIADSVSRGLAASTISAHIAGVRNLHIINGFENPLERFQRLRLVLRAVKRRGKPPRKRSPITAELLARIGALVDSARPDDVRFWAAATSAFFGFLRVSEFTVDRNFDAASDLSFDALRFSHDAAHLTLKASKTDPFRLGVSVHLGATGRAVCPVSALKQFLFLRGTAPGPLFADAFGSPPSRSWFVGTLSRFLARLGVVGDFTAHSFRIGAATTAAERGVPDHLIKVLGRWSSDAYRVYIRTSERRVCALSRTLVAS